MAESHSSRRIDAFHINVHLGEDPISDYQRLMPVLLDGSPHHLTSSRRHLAFHFERSSEIISLKSYEGDPQGEALLYDTATGTERLTPRGYSEIVATRTHAAIHLKSRVVAFEYNHRGTKIGNLEDLILQRLLRGAAKSQKFTVSLVPIVGPTFLSELEKYERIQSAVVTLVRPNPNWLDSKSPLLSYGESSHAQKMTITAVAKRDDSLSHRSGLVADLKDILKKGVQTVKEAVIRGTRSDATGLQPLRLTKHSLFKVVNLPRAIDGQPDSSRMIHDVIEYCNWLKREHPAPKEI
jgi:hypothetical protein